MKLTYIIYWTCIQSILAGKILVIHHAASSSHVSALRTVVEELAHNHQVRVLRWKDANCGKPSTHPNITETILALDNSAGYLQYVSQEHEGRFSMPFEVLWNRGLTLSQLFDVEAFKLIGAVCRHFFENKQLLEEIRAEHFDGAIVDIFLNECGLAYANVLNLPVIGYWMTFPQSGEAQFSSAFTSPALVPHIYSTGTSRMHFLQRLVNLVYAVGSNAVMQVQCWYSDNHIQEHFPGTPSSAKLLSNISGMIINSSPVVDYPQLLPPTFIQAGGFHIKPPKPVSKEIQEFVGSSEVVLFSLGMTFNPVAVPTETFKRYMRVLGRLKQKVIMKAEPGTMEVPRNVLTLPFLPQNDILAMNNTVLFITHCGMHGTMEAFHHAVPMLGIPIFFDQESICSRMEKRGVGIMLSTHSSEKELYEGITGVINDTRYQTEMNRLSRLFHSYLGQPLPRVIRLIEQILLQKGTEHMKLPSGELNFWQYFCIDTFCFLITLTIVAVWLSYVGMLAMWRWSTTKAEFSAKKTN